jgi:large subunit ribosomal protein L44
MKNKAMSTPKPKVTPDIWMALQLPSESALIAFSHRVGIGSLFQLPSQLHEICIHPSYVPFHSHYQKLTKSEPILSNNVLAPLGNSLLGFFASEYLNASYPHLPTRVLKAAVTAFVGPATCATVARETGATPLLRWQRQETALTRSPILFEDALASIPRAIVGFIHRERSMSAARKFALDFFLSRELDLRSLLKFQDPKLTLRETVESFNRERPKSRCVIAYIQLNLFFDTI